MFKINENFFLILNLTKDYLSLDNNDLNKKLMAKIRLKSSQIFQSLIIFDKLKLNEIFNLNSIISLDQEQEKNIQE
ncbi:hypothetical protein [Columbia Basin potato purple top phytoplasma]|uniref:Uncharacterized protein n=1 Tax=Columbia Basin potato purple top phytoplasma TaxID=307134 RepID=A0ABT5LA63_9MOLU|nr:hypothetical protein [Columbia Basin potato purple top phytoplasma]MDC9032089.1 hypothetical protein [Columbia Basin potato purple top phytoplasma]